MEQLDELEKPPLPILRAPSNVSTLTCPLCGDPIEMFYDDDAAETWLLFNGLEQADQRCRDAVVVELLARVVGAAA